MQLRKIDFEEEKMSKDETYFILRHRKVGQFLLCNNKQDKRVGEMLLKLLIYINYNYTPFITLPVTSCQSCTPVCAAPVRSLCVLLV